MLPVHFPQLATLMLAALISLPAGSALARTVKHDDAVPLGWSAVAGMTPQEVRDMARDLPLSRAAAPDQPWCARSTEIGAALRNEFGEERVASGAEDIALWGSQVMGTWTVVLERPDATSCIIASGIGYRKAQDPQVYFVKAGLRD